ncbi:sulfatase [Maribellus maritimus]|uniref:sulfatase n=1 Tax=Maribellus maritimus TaxID=2870838 RepID=UPI001EEB6717|nr:sulfatase [Maribellus maritimus]MCG6187348.1 sulfatase [Maribellus maritimus]
MLNLLSDNNIFNLKSIISKICLATLALIGFSFNENSDESDQRPNILVIICDDLNDSVEGMGGHPQAITPNIDRLMSEAVIFQNAHCNAPLCGPSRASLWTGIYPHKSGIIGYNQNKYTWRDSPVLKNAVTIFEHFSLNGYGVYTTGKIFHNNQHTAKLIQTLNGSGSFQNNSSFGPSPWNGLVEIPHVPHPSMKLPWGLNYFETVAPLSDVPNVLPVPHKGIPGYSGWRLNGKPFYYNNKDDRDEMPDEISAEWAIKQLQKEHEKPFFLTVGFVRPHCPWVVPDDFFNMFDPDTLVSPPYLLNDTKDCGLLSPDRYEMHDEWTNRFFRLNKAYDNGEGWKMWLRGYLASVTFVDAQIGKILDALKTSIYKNNTIVVLIADNGFHMGEKDLLRKNTVWEESTRIPFIIKLPNNEANSSKQCLHPVSLIDLYPTLIDLCELPKEPNQNINQKKLDGNSLLPLLDDPEIDIWGGPEIALTVVTGMSDVKVGELPPVNEQHYSARSQEFRYILWADGFEELYDHRKDPYEWYNLSDNPNYSQIKTRLNKQMKELLLR